MRKLLYYSDSHYTSRRPISRIDDYRASIFSKLLQIDNISRYEDVDLVLHGGDVTHIAQEGYDIFNDLYSYHSNTYVKHLVVAGLTHDYMSHASIGLAKSTLGALQRTGALDIVDRYNTIDFELDGVKFHSSHQAICPTPFFGHFQLYKDFKTDADIVLTSHLHMSFGIQKVGDVTFVSPGSISRNSGDVYNIGRVPQCVLICVDNGKIDKIEFIPLEVRQNIWNTKHILAKEESKNLETVSSLDSLESFMSQEEDDLDASSIIQRIGSKYDREAVETALMLKERVENGTNE
jgi:predicted phosphodiesterase